MTQALYAAIESVNALSLEEKHQLWLMLEEAIVQAEEQDWLEDNETATEIDFNEPFEIQGLERSSQAIKDEKLG